MSYNEHIPGPDHVGGVLPDPGVWCGEQGRHHVHGEPGGGQCDPGRLPREVQLLQLQHPRHRLRGPAHPDREGGLALGNLLLLPRLRSVHLHQMLQSCLHEVIQFSESS